MGRSFSLKLSNEYIFPHDVPSAGSLDELSMLRELVRKQAAKLKFVALRTRLFWRMRSRRKHMARVDSVEMPILLALGSRVCLTEPDGSVFKQSTG